MPDLNIRIDTTANVDGVKQTADELKKLGQASSDLPPILGKETEATEKNVVAKGRLREQFRLLRHAVPELSSVFAALTHPLTAVVALFGVAAVAVRRYIAEVDAAAAASAGFAQWNRAATQTARLARVGAEAAADFAKSLKDTQTAAEGARDAINQVNDGIDKQIRRENELADEQMALDMERVSASEARGEITPERGLELRMGIRRQFEIQRADRQQQGEFKKGDAAFFKAQSLRAVAAAAQAGVPGAQAELERRRVEAATAESVFAAETGTLQQQRGVEAEKIRQAESVLDPTLYLDQAPAWTPVGIFRGIQRSRATKAKDQAEARIADIDRQLEQAGIVRDAATGRFKTAQENLSTLGTTIRESTAAAEQFSFQGGRTHAQARAEGGHFARRHAIQLQAGQLAIDTAIAKQEAQKTEADRRRLDSALSSLLGSQSGAYNTIIQRVDQLTRENEGLQKKLHALHGQ